MEHNSSATQCNCAAMAELIGCGSAESVEIKKLRGRQPTAECYCRILPEYVAKELLMHYKCRIKAWADGPTGVMAGTRFTKGALLHTVV